MGLVRLGLSFLQPTEHALTSQGVDADNHQTARASIATYLATIGREFGYDDRSIADALGQKNPERALFYAGGADLNRKMRGIVTEFDAEVNRWRTKVVNPT